VIGANRARPASALLVVVVLLGLLGSGAALAHPGTDQASQQAVAAAPLHAGQLVVRDHAAGLRALAERGRRQGPADTSMPVAALVGVLAWAGLGSRRGAWRSASAAGPRGLARRTWSRAPPCCLQPV
jgi:hypothetical protein